MTPKPTEPPQLRPTAPPAPTPYPAPLPARVNLRTHGEASISTERVAMSVRTRFNPLRGFFVSTYAAGAHSPWVYAWIASALLAAVCCFAAVRILDRKEY